MEQWKDVVGYEGLYLISNYGRVKSVRKNKIMKTQRNRRGYERIRLRKNGKCIPHFIHKLEALTFIEGHSENREVHHINVNPSDNRLNNLRSVTREEHDKIHYQDRRETVKCSVCGNEFVRCKSHYRKTTCSDDCSNKLKNRKKRSVIQKTKDGQVVKVWSSFNEIHKELGYSATNICACCRGKDASYKGYKWEYNEDLIKCKA